MLKLLQAVSKKLLISVEVGGFHSHKFAYRASGVNPVIETNFIATPCSIIIIEPFT